MFRRFLVGYDGSELSREALAYSVMLAKAISDEVEVHVMHVIEPTSDITLAGDPSMLVDPMLPPVLLAETDDAILQAEKKKAEAMLDEVEDSCDDMGVKLTTRVIRGGLVEALLGQAGADDVIALGLKGRFRRSGVGSTTRSLVTNAPCPVLVASGPLSPVNRVLTPYDGSIPSTRALMVARGLASKTKWPLTILAVPRDGLSLEESQDWSHQLASEAQIISMNTALGTEAELIERTVGADPYALLVMGAYADSWFKDLIGGSTTSHVLSHLRAPIILVPKGASTSS